MREFAALILLVGLATAATWRQPQGRASCRDTARTQAALNECAAAERRGAEEELNKAYELLLARAGAKDSAAARKIRAAQEAWMAYRDAQIEAMFAAGQKQTAYGSVYPMCVQQLRARWAAERTKELRAMMSRPEEGDVCCGDRYTGAD